MKVYVHIYNEDLSNDKDLFLEIECDFNPILGDTIFVDTTLLAEKASKDLYLITRYRKQLYCDSYHKRDEGEITLEDGDNLLFDDLFYVVGRTFICNDITGIHELHIEIGEYQDLMDVLNNRTK